MIPLKFYREDLKQGGYHLYYVGAFKNIPDKAETRLILLKECLKLNIVRFIIEDNLKPFYYRGLKDWDRIKGFIMDTCLTARDRFMAYLDCFRIEH